MSVFPQTRKRDWLSKEKHYLMMLQAAKDALGLSQKYGVNIHIFASPYMTKLTFK